MQGAGFVVLLGFRAPAAGSPRVTGQRLLQKRPASRWAARHAEMGTWCESARRVTATTAQTQPATPKWAPGANPPGVSQQQPPKRSPPRRNGHLVRTRPACHSNNRPKAARHAEMGTWCDPTRRVTATTAQQLPASSPHSRGTVGQAGTTPGNGRTRARRCGGSRGPPRRSLPAPHRRSRTHPAATRRWRMSQPGRDRRRPRAPSPAGRR